MSGMSLKSAFAGCRAGLLPLDSKAHARTTTFVIRAQADELQVVTRRGALSLGTGAAVVFGGAQVSQAAFGDAAAVFKQKPTNTSGFIPYSGEGFALLLPSKWNPSKEREADGVQLRYEDNGDSLNNVVVIAKRSDKASIEGYGGPDAFLNNISSLFGTQVFKGETVSEGGFLPNKVSAASLLDASKATNNGKTYYTYELLTRSADGNEGGRHQLVTAAVSNGTLYICKVQIGDKRWFKGAAKEGKGVFNSFVVA